MSSHEGDIIPLAPESVEALRLILEKQEGREVTYSEALEIGGSLIRFFKTLGAKSEPAPLS